MGYTHSARTIFILGMPRSGTTWLAKIFDSHPDILYRHEPDIINRNEALPPRCERDEIADHVHAAQEWLNDLAKINVVKTAGTQPVFRKSYHTWPQTAARSLFISALRAAGKIPGIGLFAQSVKIPDFVNLESNAYSKLVVKSVSSLGRASLLAAAAPDSHFIFILRHPCGEVASRVRGVKEGRLEHDASILRLSEMPQARRRHLTAERLAELPLHAQLAWSWALYNERALEDLSGIKYLTILRYEDLAEHPEKTAKQLFEFCGIDWRAENSAFLDASSRATGREGYYEIKRNPVEASNKWRTMWSQGEADTIFEIAAQTLAGRMFLTPESAGTRTGSNEAIPIMGPRVLRQGA